MSRVVPALSVAAVVTALLIGRQATPKEPAGVAFPQPWLDRIPAGAHRETLTVDADAHCVYLGMEQIPERNAAKVALRTGHRYTVKAAGAAYLSEQTGAESDPAPGVVLFYATGEEDGFATRYAVLPTGGTVTFRTPDADPEDVYLAAFFLDAWPQSENIGRYTLTITGEKVIR